MKQGPLTYKYIKQVNEKGRYGAVTIQIIKTNKPSTVTDACEWKTLKDAYDKFEELDILKIWKKSAINAATEIINRFSFPDNIEVIIKDVIGVYVDTCPSHIGAAIAIGIFEYCDEPLNSSDLEMLDDFLENNNKIDLIPDYSHLKLTRNKLN